MSALNLNKVILGGHLTAVPELKQTPQGVSVTSFSVAVNRKGAKNNEVDFINCVAWRNTAEIICKYYKKGNGICVVGSIQTRSWNDNNGNKRYATEVVADEAHFVDSKSEGNADAFSPTPTVNEHQGDNIALPNVELEECADEDLPF